MICITIEEFAFVYEKVNKMMKNLLQNFSLAKVIFFSLARHLYWKSIDILMSFSSYKLCLYEMC